MDIITFLEDNEIEFHTKGKNIAPGWIGLNCIFCDDYSNHLGIRLSDLKVSCWRCGSHSIYTTLKELTGATKKEIRDVVKYGEEVDIDIAAKPSKQMVKVWKKLRMPEALSVDQGIPHLHYKYLEKRGFYPNLVSRRYDLHFVTTYGKWKFRIIIPYYYRRRLYSFSTRAIDPRMSPPYLHPNSTEAFMTPKQLVYNIDNLREHHDCMASEGPVDVWKWGDGGVSLSGLMFTKYQIERLKEKKIRRLFIMFDNDIIIANGRKIRNTASRRKALELYRIMRHNVEDIEILTNEITNDLGEMTAQEVLEVKSAIDFDKGL